MKSTFRESRKTTRTMHLGFKRFIWVQEVGKLKFIWKIKTQQIWRYEVLTRLRQSKSWCTCSQRKPHMQNERTFSHSVSFYFQRFYKIWMKIFPLGQNLSSSGSKSVPHLQRLKLRVLMCKSSTLRQICFTLISWIALALPAAARSLWLQSKKVLSRRTWAAWLNVCWLWNKRPANALSILSAKFF